MTETHALTEGVRSHILRVVDALTRFGAYDFKKHAYVRIERRSINWALQSYKSTLLAITPKMEGEPLSGTMVESAQVEWKREPAAEVGFKVRQRHIGIIRPQMRPLVDWWVKSGKPFPSGGGFYVNIPNKSYQRVAALSKFPEYRDAIIQLGLEEDWLAFWELYIPMRYKLSRELLQSLKSGADREALSRGNEAAGTGIAIRGRRLTRADLVDVRHDLDFALDYAAIMGIAFAAVQLAPLEGDSVWVVNVYDPRIRGAVASRSDMDVLESKWDGERLIIEGVAQTRQAGSDATGLLTNSSSEKKLMGRSLTEEVLRAYKHEKTIYPFNDYSTVLKAWGLNAKPFPGREYLIGEDFGLMEPVKSPADALFSRGFLSIGTKVLPLMLSGSSWTQAVYGVFHRHFSRKLGATDTLLCLGDDMNLITSHLDESIFAPYIKVKSTDQQQNTKKILGQYTAMPRTVGGGDAVIGVVPRVLKTISSATKAGTHWQDVFSRLGPEGKIELQHDPATQDLMREELPRIIPYLGWKGPVEQLDLHIRNQWGRMTVQEWDILLAYDPDLAYKLQPDTLETRDQSSLDDE